MTAQRSKTERSGGLNLMLIVGVAAVLGLAFFLLGRGPEPGVVAPSVTPTGVAPQTGPPKDFKNRFAYKEKDSPEITVKTLGPRSIPVINIHEHVRDRAEMPRLIEAMDRFNIKRVCLMAASWYTYTLDPQFGFERFKENNEELLEIKRLYPDRTCVFVTIHPPEDGNLALIQDYAKRGADGLKLYLGHGAATGKGPFHMMTLDDERMLPIYAWAEKTAFPILMHVNFIKYYDEFVSVMDRTPHLHVAVPHFGLHKNTAPRLARLARLFDHYPNFFTDVSFGFHTFHREGFEALSKWKSRSQAYITKYADRIMFASDMVLEPTKNEQYIDETLRSYFQWLEMDAFRFFMVPKYTMKGLSLGEPTLRKMYWETPRRFLLADVNGKLPDRTQNWPPSPAPWLPPQVPDVAPFGKAKAKSPEAPAPASDQK